MIKEWFLNEIYDALIYNYTLKRKAFSLLRSKFIITNPLYNYFYEKEIQNKMEKYREVPFRGIVENTNVCNAHCTFCPHKAMTRPVGIMSQSLFEKIIDEFKFLNVKYVSICGFGEPLLDPSFSEKLSYAKSKGIERVTTNTNLGFLNEKIARKIVEVEMDEIYVSIDAATDETYRKLRPNLNFKLVEDNIYILLKIRKASHKVKPTVILSYVESDVNRHETEKFTSKWDRLVDGISISQIHNWTGDVNHGGVSETFRRRDPCRLLWTDMVISWDGLVPLCCLDYENKIVLGDVKKNSIKEIWNYKKLAAIRNYHRNREFERISLCKNCEYNYHDKAPWWISK